MVEEKGREIARERDEAKALIAAAEAKCERLRAELERYGSVQADAVGDHD